MSGVRAPMLGTPDMATHTGFILAEDAALHTYLSGLEVPNRPGDSKMTEVGVWFRFPEGERAIKYPFITIDLIDVSPAYELWTSEYIMSTDGLYQPSVSPTMPVPDADMNLDVRNFLPFKLTYQVSVHCRSSLHDRYLMSHFFTDVFPPRPFWMGVDADNTWRRVELVDSAQADLMETTESGNKRIFRKVYTISMLAEVPQESIRQAWQVLRVYTPIVDRSYVDDFLYNVLTNPNTGESVLGLPDSVPSDFRERHGEYATAIADFAHVYPSTASATALASAANS
jgi:hypothetical protein